jgi:hypothetical protein
MTMGTQYKVGIDSNCLTLLIEAVDPDYDSVMDNAQLAEEKKAILRIFFYVGITYYVGPTVEKEYKSIKNNEKYQKHCSICDNLLLDGPWRLNNSFLLERSQMFKTHHSGQEDCDILAETEEMSLDILLTNDKNFINRLASITKSVKLIKPSRFWLSLGVPKGSKTILRPAHSNPLFHKTWWRW